MATVEGLGRHTPSPPFPPQSSPGPSSSPPPQGGPQQVGENVVNLSSSSALTLSVQLSDLRGCDSSDAQSKCAFAPSDTSLFVGHDDGTVSFWTWTSGKEAQVLVTLRCCSPFPVVAIVPCKLPGRASGSVAILQADGSLNLVNEGASAFDASSAKCVTSVGEVRGACSFADGRLLAIVGESASILVLELSTFSPTHLLHGHEDWISSIAAWDDAASASSTLVSCGDDGVVLLWKWRADNFAGDLRRTAITFPGGSDGQSVLTRDPARRYSLSFGGGSLLVVSPFGDCGIVEVAQLEARDNVECAPRMVASKVLAAQFIASSKGEMLVVLAEAGSEVLMYRRAKVKTSDYSFFTYEKLSTLLDLGQAPAPQQICSSCRCSCAVAFLAPLRTSEGACLLHGTCSGETLMIKAGSSSAIKGSRGRGAFQSYLLSAIIAPDQANFHSYPTVVLKEVVQGVLGASFLPDWPSLPPKNGHDKPLSKITLLTSFPSWSWDNGGTRIAVVGRENGRVELVRISVPRLESETFSSNESSLVVERVALVQVHVKAVLSVSTSPESSRSDRDSRTFCTIGAENDVVVFSLTPMRGSSKVTLHCLFRFSGHHSSVRSVYWDVPGSALHVRCDKTFVWSLLSGTLERRTGNALDYSFKHASRTSASTGAIFFAHTPTSLVAGTFEGDSDPLSRSSGARRVDIAAEESEGASMQARSVDFPLSVRAPCARFAVALEWSMGELGETLRLLVERGLGDRCGRAYGAALSLLHEWGMEPDLDEACKAKLGMRRPPPELVARFCYRQRFPSGAVGTVIGHKRWATSDMLTANQDLGLVALFLTATTFQSAPSSSGVGGSVPVSDVFSQLVTAYGIRFPDALRVRAEWREPSLPFLARQALVHERKDELSSGNHVAARLLLQRTVERMPAPHRTALVTDWATRLARLRDSMQAQLAHHQAASGQPPLPPGTSPMQARAAASRVGAGAATATPQMGGSGAASAKRSSTTELSALESESMIVEEETPMDERLRHLIVSSREYQLLVLLLAVVGVVHPEDVTPTSARLVTETLVELVSARGETASGGRTGGLAAATTTLHGQLTSSANFIQHQFRNLPTHVQRLSSSSSGTATPSSGTTTPSSALAAGEAIAINSAFAAELLAKGFALFRPHILHMSRLIKKLLLLATDAEDITQRATAADRALSEVGAAHPVLFVRTIGSEACRKEASDAYRRKCLEVLVNLVKNFPVIFLRHLPMVAEVVIKTLDPSDPALRSSCLGASTLALQELVKRYPMISFHQNSQRFAVGTVESQIIVYDLRTATKWRVLEGTEGSVSAVAFEREGEKMASYSASEHSVRIWATRSPGLFGNLLTIRGTFLASIQLPKLRGDAVEDMLILKECRLEWTSPTELKLRRETGQVDVLKVNHV